MFRGSIQVLASIDHSNLADAVSDDHKVIQAISIALSEGTADNQAQTAYSKTRTLAGSANEDLDLLALLPDVLSPGLSATKLRALIIAADGANGGNIVLKPSASNGLVGPFGGTAPTFTIKAGGIFTLIEPLGAGWPLDATHKSLNFANSDSASAHYAILAVAA